MTTTQADRFEGGEEAARADLYGLLAALLYAPPPQALLDAIRSAPVAGDGVLETAWRGLARAASAPPEAIREEYESLFIGVGKPEVMLYGSYYLSGFLMEKPLADLRADLARMGFERAAEMTESEDHIAALCDVMRNLIISDDSAHNELAAQAVFFSTHMQPWAGKFCDALQAHQGAGFYAAVACLAAVFFEVERQAFEMA